jgi:hypothetical protein
VTDKTLRILLGGSRAAPLEKLEESRAAWHLGTFSILKHQASYHNGFGYALHPESCFYKRWFNFPDLEKSGWAVLFHASDPDPGSDPDDSEQFPGWVPAERVGDADIWIEFLNGEVRARLADEAQRRSRDATGAHQ